MKKKKGGGGTIILLACVLAVPTVAEIMGLYDAPLTLEAAKPALLVGAVLGLAHLLLRPVLRFMFSAIGCLTFGLFGIVIDVGLIYASARSVPGFEVPGPLYAVLTALVINVVCAVAGGRR